MESGYRDAVFVEMERGSNLKSRLSEEDTIHTSRPACRREDNPEKKKKIKFCNHSVKFREICRTIFCFSAYILVTVAPASPQQGVRATVAGVWAVGVVEEGVW